MRAEEHDGLIRRVKLAPGFVQLTLDQVRHRLRVPGPLVPARNHAVRHRRREVVVLHEDLLQQAKRRAAGADGELRVEGQDHELGDAVRLDLVHGLLGERLPVPHAHIALRVFNPLGAKSVGQGVRLLVGDAP